MIKEGINKQKMTFRERSDTIVGVSLKRIICVTLLMVCIGVLCVHESNQQKRIVAMEEKIKLLQAESNRKTVHWNPENYNYLAIGNSITLHQINDYWWNECGMAATTLEKDYVHQTSIMLNATEYAYNFSIWEITASDRTQTLSLLDGLLSNDIDLITLQLSENTSDLDTFDSDFEEMIRYIQERCSNAQIIVIGDFWDTGTKDEMKSVACVNTGVSFISLDEIKNKPEYECEIGTEVYDSDGQPHIVEHKGVSLHPNDKGMKWIADRIVEEVKSAD